MQLRHILFILILSLVSYSFGTELRGTVYDTETHLPLENVNVSIVNSSAGAASDQDGRFRISGVAVGIWQVNVSRIGYLLQKQSITVESGKFYQLDFYLKASVIQLAPVSIEGMSERNLIQKPLQESSGLAVAMTKITAPEIRQQGSKTVIEAVKYVPGAFVETRGRKVKEFVSFRGQRYPYPTYAFNGAWQHEFHELPYFFAAGDIEKIEVLRSSSALLAGQNNLAGVIDIQTRSYQSSKTMAEVEYGSFDSYRLYLSHGGRQGAVSYATGVNYRDTQGPAGKHAAEQMGNYYGQLAWQPSSKFQVKLNLFRIDGQRELLLAEPPAVAKLQNTLEQFDPYAATLSTIQLQYHPHEKWTTDVQLHYSERQPVYVLQKAGAESVSKTHEDDYELGARLTQAIQLTHGNTLRFGGGYNHWWAPNGKRFYSGKRCDLETFSLVLVDEQRWNRLTGDIGVRMERTYVNEYAAYNIDGSGGLFKKVTPVKDKWESPVFIATMGAAYRLSPLWMLNINLAGGRIQSRSGTLTAKMTDPEIEKQVKLDAGVRLVVDGVGQFTLTGFGVSQQAAIVLSGQTITMDDGRILELYENRDQDKIGVEFECRLGQLFNCLEGFVTATVMQSRIKNEGTVLSDQDVPQFIASAGVYFNSGRWTLNLLGKYVSGFESTRFAANPTTPVPLGDFLTGDLVSAFQFVSNSRSQVYLEVKNVMDVAYSTVVGYPDFGRKFTIGIRNGW
ncbi:TonB-dependent receptor [bacterium]|nr:TonB-dependent receptor [bacterium]